jgi:hypothetical protein
MDGWMKEKIIIKKKVIVNNEAAGRQMIIYTMVMERG